MFCRLDNFKPAGIRSLHNVKRMADHVIHAHAVVHPFHIDSLVKRRSINSSSELISSQAGLHRTANWLLSGLMDVFIHRV